MARIFEWIKEIFREQPRCPKCGYIRNSIPCEHKVTQYECMSCHKTWRDSNWDSPFDEFRPLQCIYCRGGSLSMGKVYCGFTYTKKEQIRLIKSWEISPQLLIRLTQLAEATTSNVSALLEELTAEKRKSILIRNFTIQGLCPGCQHRRTNFDGKCTNLIGIYYCHRCHVSYTPFDLYDLDGFIKNMCPQCGRQIQKWETRTCDFAIPKGQTIYIIENARK